MFTKNQTNPPSRDRKRIPLKIHLVILAGGLLLAAWTPARAQMGYSVIWSETRLDSSTNPANVVGTGITSDSYNIYGHRYWVTTTVASPSGRTASGQSYTSGSYARIDIFLDGGFEFGGFTINTTHSMTCPYMFNVTNGFTGITIWLTRSSYRATGGPDASGKCTFVLDCAAGTSATCALSNPRGLPVGTNCAEINGGHFWCLDTSVNGVCVSSKTMNIPMKIPPLRSCGASPVRVRSYCFQQAIRSTSAFARSSPSFRMRSSSRTTQAEAMTG